LRRSNYAIYEASAFECDTETGDCDQYNLRASSDHERFDDDSATTTFDNVTERAYVEHVNGDFDGLGHFRQKNTYGDLKVVGRPNATASDWDHHIDYKLFNPNVNWNPGQPNPTGLPAYWITGTFAHTTAIESGRLSSTLFQFDPTRGFLRATRKAEAFTNTGGMPIPPDSARDIVAATSGDDFLAVFTRTGTTDDDGQLVVVVRETNYGGDGGHLGGWDPQSGDLGISSQTHRDYVIDTTYRYGTPAKAEYKDCNLNDTFLLKESAFIEPGVGAPLTTTDESGLTANYAYDSLGRVTQVSPPGGQAPQTYTYQTKTGPAGINRLTVARAGGSVGK
jgi:YD repeat-containing protein